MREILVSIEADNPVEENKAALMPHQGVVGSADRALGAPLVGRQDPSAEGKCRQRGRMENAAAQVYSVLRI